MPGRWISQIVFVCIWLGIFVLLGLWFDGLGWWLISGLLLYLIHTFRNLYSLDQALRGGKYIPPQMEGLWAELFAEVEKLKTKSRNRKKRYNRLFREVKESTGALHDAGIILNSASEIQWFNPAATRLIGLDPKTDIGQRIDNFLRHPDLVKHLSNPQEEFLTIPSVRGDKGQLSIQVIPYGKSQNLAIVRDVTKEVKLERTRRDFVANASHELRSPLTVIGGYLDALADDEGLPDNWRNPINEMERQVERMTQILHDLIELAKLDSGESQIPSESVNIVNMIRLIVHEFSDKKGIARVQLKLNTDVFLSGSEPSLYSIFYNLIHNAVRFTPEEGEILCTWSLIDEGVEFSVKDSGIGIPEDMISRITERFFRVDPGRSRELGGTGLGLAIVKHSLETHEAKLYIESEIGKGSLFTCVFPKERIIAHTEEL